MLLSISLKSLSKKKQNNLTQKTNFPLDAGKKNF
jgi:hypothetical protein